MVGGIRVEYATGGNTFLLFRPPVGAVLFYLFAKKYEKVVRPPGPVGQKGWWAGVLFYFFDPPVGGLLFYFLATELWPKNGGRAELFTFLLFYFLVFPKK